MALNSKKASANNDERKETVPPIEKGVVNQGQPGALRRFNIDAIVRKIQIDAPITRAELARATDLSYPTVMKISNILLDNNIVEWVPDGSLGSGGRGRPASYIQMASISTHVVAISFQPNHILGSASGLDGRTLLEKQCPLPKSYAGILKAGNQLIAELQDSLNSRALGLGLTVPGQLETDDGVQTIKSPSIPAINGQPIVEDLRRLTNLPTVAVTNMRALYNSETIRGQAAALDNFVILSYYSGMALAASCNNAFIEGSDGMAGGLGHFVVNRGGELCECGNRGCLDTLATDLALAHSISRKMERTVTVDEAFELIRKSPYRFEVEIDNMLDYLAIAVGGTINIFNPEAIFVHGRLLEIEDMFLGRLRKKILHRCPKGLASHCILEKSKSSMNQGAALAIVTELTSTLDAKL